MIDEFSFQTPVLELSRKPYLTTPTFNNSFSSCALLPQLTCNSNARATVGSKIFIRKNQQT